MTVSNKITHIVRPVITALTMASALIDLALRMYVARIFWQSGQTKIGNMDSTTQLFEQVYQVPLLPPAVAAYLATGAELLLPILLVFGFATRFAAFFLTIFNIVAVISFPELSVAAMQQHIVWGMMLLVVLLHGPGKLAIDHLIHKKYWH